VPVISYHETKLGGELSGGVCPTNTGGETSGGVIVLPKTGGEFSDRENVREKMSGEKCRLLDSNSIVSQLMEAEYVPAWSTSLY
jgi:hypothetical protein